MAVVKRTGLKPKVFKRFFDDGSQLIEIENLTALMLGLPVIGMSAVNEGVKRMNQAMEDVYHDGQAGFWEPNTELTRKLWAKKTGMDGSDKDVMEGILGAQDNDAALTKVVGIGEGKGHQRMAGPVRKTPHGVTRDYGWPDIERPDRPGHSVAEIAMAHEFGFEIAGDEKTGKGGAVVPPRPWLTAAASKYGTSVTLAMVDDAEEGLIAYDISKLIPGLLRQSLFRPIDEEDFD